MSLEAGAAAGRNRGPSYAGNLKAAEGGPIAANAGRIPILRRGPCSALLAAPLAGMRRGEYFAVDRVILKQARMARRQQI
jgi:hypothetical protein